MNKFVVLLRNGMQVGTPTSHDDVNKAYRILNDEKLGGKFIIAPEKGEEKIRVRVDDVVGMLIMEQSNLAIPQQPSIVPFGQGQRR